jgi:hypothetical protein
MEEIKENLIKKIEEEIIKTIKEISKRYEINEKEAIEYILKERKNEKGRGRPRKDKEEKEEIKVKGARGRPPKEEKKVYNKVGEDLISRLLEKARLNVNKEEE